MPDPATLQLAEFQGSKSRTVKPVSVNPYLTQETSASAVAILCRHIQWTVVTQHTAPRPEVVVAHDADVVQVPANPTTVSSGLIKKKSLSLSL